MRKVSLKTGLRAVFYALTALVMSVCLAEPINLTVFVNAPEISGEGGIIERGQEKVVLAEGSEGKAGPGKITNLTSNQYYTIEEWGENPTPNTRGSVKFVTANGGRADDLTGIGRLTGNEIKELTNNNTYMVRAAELLPADGITILPSTSTSIVDGKITLPHGSTAMIFPIAFDIGYNFVKIPVSPPAPTGYTPTLDPFSGNITLESAGTTDYIFYNDTSIQFYVLTVTIVPPPELTITITPYTHGTDKAYVFSPSDKSFTFAEATASTGLNINVAVVPNPYDTGTFGWYYGDTQVSTNATLTTAGIKAAITNFDFSVAGNYPFIFKGEIGGVVYASTFTIIIEAQP